MRGFFIVLLLICVHCKMVDLDCALTDPLHCQTLFESGDNSFSHQAAHHVIVPVVLVYVGPATGPLVVAPPARPAALVALPFELPAASRRRPPPLLLT